MAETTHHSPLTTHSQTREYVRPIPATWWLKNPAYTKFILRELSSVFIAGYCIFLMVLLYKSSDSQAFASFYEGLKSPVSVVLHLVVLGFALFNSITAMNAAPRIVTVFRGDEKVPDHLIAGGHYLMWLAMSVILIVITLVAA